MPDRPTEHRREPLNVRIDSLEDSMSHFYKVINELRERVSTTENRLNALTKDNN